MPKAKPNLKYQTAYYAWVSKLLCAARVGDLTQIRSYLNSYSFEPELAWSILKEAVRHRQDQILDLVPVLSLDFQPSLKNGCTVTEQVCQTFFLACSHSEPDARQLWVSTLLVFLEKNPKVFSKMLWQMCHNGRLLESPLGSMENLSPLDTLLEKLPGFTLSWCKAHHAQIHTDMKDFPEWLATFDQKILSAEHSVFVIKSSLPRSRL